MTVAPRTMGWLTGADSFSPVFLSVSPSQSNIQAALRAFLIAVLPTGTEVIEGQDNRVSEPAAVDFVVFTVIRRRRIETNIHTYADLPGAGIKDVLQPTELTVQLDVHGPASADNAQIISTLMRDEYAVDFFAAINPAVVPLYADDPRQIPFINDQAQYENRWIIEAVLQANIVVTVPQQFADSIVVDLVSVEAVYPP